MVGRRKGWVCAALGVLVGSAAAMAVPIAVGSGSNRAEVYIEFGNGANYTFDVAFTGTVNGMELLDIIEAATTLTTTRVYGGMYLDGISYDGHGNAGFSGGENWWHYWTREGDGEWFAPQSYGAFDRLAVDGSADGWIYGRVGAPVPEPATALLCMLAVSALVRRPHRTHLVPAGC